MAYDRGGLKALKSKPSGGRQRENMSLAEERALLARFAKAAGAGEMLNIHDLKAAYEKAIGHETSNSTVYNLLARHGWRKLMPRPFHPKRENAARRRLPAHPRIHLSVRRGLSQGRNLRLSDHADIEHRLLPGLPRSARTNICQAGCSPGH